MKIFSGLKTRKLVKSIEKNPGSFKNYRDLIQIYMNEEKFDEAHIYLDKANSQTWSQQENDWLAIQNLRIEVSEGKPPEAIVNAALKIANSTQSEPETRLEAALTAAPVIKSILTDLDQDQIQTALEVFNQVNTRCQDLPRVVELMIEQVELQTLIGSTVDTIDQFRIILEKAEAQKRKKLGKLYLRGATVVSRIAPSDTMIRPWLTRALESDDLTDSETIEVLAQLANLLRIDDDLLGAMERYETALRFAGNDSSAIIASVRFNLAQVYFQLGRLPQAEKEIQEALSSKHIDAETRASYHFWYAGAHDEQGHLEKALENCNKVMELTQQIPLKLKTLTLRSKISESKNDIDTAVSDMESVLELSADDSDYSMELNLARLYNLQTTYHKALKIVRQLQKDSEAIKHLGIENILQQQAMAQLGQGKTLRCIETQLEILETARHDSGLFSTVRKQLNELKKELQSPEGIKKYKIDSSDRKQLTALLAAIPSEDDFFTRLRSGLMKTRSGLIGGIEKILKGSSVIDEDVLDDIEELMILSDLGVETTEHIIDGLRDKLRKKELHNAEVVRNHIRTEIETILSGHSGSIEPRVEAAPYIIMMVGVNGVGKTTTIAKIANRLKEEGKSLLLAAGDTFRAGAIEQLKEWGRRLEIEVIAGAEGSDPSSVAWDAVAAAKSRNVDVLIIDTAGRLHTKSNLMDELKKVNKVVDKNMPGAPHETLLVLDATTGQNAVLQAREFSQIVDLTGIVLTKLDGTAKGGIIVSIVQEIETPIKLIGIGERMDDLRDFNAEEFAMALFDQTESKPVNGESGDSQ